MTTDWVKLGKELSSDLSNNSKRKKIQTKQGHVIVYEELNAARSKLIIDRVDVTFGKHFEFNDEEIDFIINYDIKYRLGSRDLDDRSVAPISSSATKDD